MRNKVPQGIALFVVGLYASAWLFAIGVFYALVFRAAYRIGHIPSYDNPDPSTVGFNKDSLHDLVLEWTLRVIVCLFPFYLVAQTVRVMNQGFKSKILLLVVAVQVFGFYLLFVSPLAEWYLD